MLTSFIALQPSYDQGYIQIVFKREAEKWPEKKKKKIKFS
jgi:hypothetical protein